MQAKEQLQPKGEALRLIPEPLAPEMDKPAPYPIDAMPPLMRDAVKAIIEHVQVPDAIAAFSVLGAVNYLAQTRVNAQTPVKYSMPCSLFMLALGDSGVRKSSAFETVFKPLNDAEQRKMEVYGQLIKEHKKELSNPTGKAKKQFLLDNPEPPTPITIISSDASYSRIASMLIDEAPALFWSSDEGSQMLSGHSMKADDRAAMLGGLTKWWDSGKGQRIRSRSNEDASGNAYGKRLGLFLLAQEITIKEVLSDPVLRGQGFLPRFLFASPAPLNGKRLLSMDAIRKQAHEDPRLTMFWDRLEKLAESPRGDDPEYSNQLKLEPLSLCEESARLWIDAYNSIESEQGNAGAFADLRAFASRAGENIGRVAANLAFFDGKQQVDVEAMKAAIAIVNHSLGEWLRYSNDSVLDSATSNAIKVIAWLVEKLKQGDARWQKFTANLWGKSGEHSTQLKKYRDPAFKILLDTHHLLYDDTDKTYRVNPILLEAGAESAESAEAYINQGLQNAEALRISAETVRDANTDAKNPQPSANHPQAETLGNIEHPQNPQNPQQVGGNNKPWEGVL